MAITTISAAEIQSIQVIEESKNVVLIVTQRNSNRPIVVKSEEGRGRDNVGAMLEFHASLFSKLRSLPFETERLSLAEIDALKNCSPSKVAGARAFTQQTWLALLDEKMLHIGATREMKAVIKISYVEQLANLKGLGNKAVELQQLRQLLSQGGKEADELVREIGEILAVDFFIGNGDRFEDQEKKGTAFPRGTIKGDQNIFFSLKNGKFEAVGIDTYDAGGIWSDLNKTVEELENVYEPQGWGFWPGRILSPGATRDRDDVARAVVESFVNITFSGDGAVPKPNDGVKSKLVKACHQGISGGKEMLRRKYSLNDSLQGLSKGLASRWKIVKG